MTTASAADPLIAPPDVTPAERDAISRMTAHLTAAYAPGVPADQVVATIQRIYRGFAEAHIRDFVPVLVERAAIRELGRPAA
ncbi:hypothetical protein KDK95_32525 [Actinospica sp. MGRD01-02]|uniref:Uncharacterized protein n=1 Tax=Actinospica acidithermotolerans TaxID=2828514 RepID=A0A941EGK6_9ACTN|nr:hypothetical protein [Actinospica acidithermotolerans]MBR7831076.1 hypothetical protein [Actinospica acidithermotolerans]